MAEKVVLKSAGSILSLTLTLNKTHPAQDLTWEAERSSRHKTPPYSSPEIARGKIGIKKLLGCGHMNVKWQRMATA